MITVVAYLKGIPASNNNPEKPRSLTSFIAGVNSLGDHGVLNSDNNLLKADVAVIQGYVHEEGKIYFIYLSIGLFASSHFPSVLSYF